MSTATISVIIPTRNRSKEVIRALHSVMRQTIQPVQVIVVDDASTDDTADAIRKGFPGVMLLRNEIAVGGAGARNLGAAQAVSDFVAFLDSDDEWLPMHLENAIALINLKGADATFGTFNLLKESELIPVRFFKTSYPKGTIGDHIFSFERFDARTSTFVFKRNAFLEVRFDDNLRKHQDWDLAINFDRKFTWALDAEPSVLIHIAVESDRMSSKLNHGATMYFLEKNARHVHPDYLFAFGVKQIMRCQLNGESKDIIRQYTQFLKKFSTKLSLKNRVILSLLRSKLLNVGYLYRLKKLLGK